MRIQGNLIKWNDDRGFGFISSPQEANEVFIHISAFPKEGKRPKIGELISFELEIEGNGKKRAARVLRPSSALKKRKRAKYRPENTTSPLRTGFTLFTIFVVGYFGYNYYNSSSSPLLLVPERASKSQSPATQDFKCDGRQHCSQMTSRAEAEFFVRNCPNTKMDGDLDGIPCENDSRF